MQGGGGGGGGGGGTGEEGSHVPSQGGHGGVTSTHWPSSMTYEGVTYEPSAHTSAMAGSPRSPQSGFPEDEPTPELELELDVTPELELTPELEPAPELDPEPPVGVGNTSPEHPAEKMLPATARATGKSAKGDRNMRPRISMSQAEEWRALTDEIIGVRPCQCEPLRSARQRAPSKGVRPSRLRPA